MLHRRGPRRPAVRQRVDHLVAAPGHRPRDPRRHRGRDGPAPRDLRDAVRPALAAPRGRAAAPPGQPMTFFSMTGRPRGDPLEPEDREVQGHVAAVDDELGDRPADGRRLLDAVAAEAVREVQVRELRRRAEQGVVVERVDLVVAGPRPGRP